MKVKKQDKLKNIIGAGALSFFAFLTGLVFISAIFAFPVSASTTDGTIDSVYKYAWEENIGWINFGTANGNVHVTDSGMTGYALSETAGWINLSNIINDGEGNLSGYGWSENTGWIKFNPANGGVIINSSGEFTGSALSENIGWIIFGGDYKVKTDWRPQSARPCVSWTYSDWSGCSVGQQTRTIISSSPSGCSGGSPILSQTCSSGGGLPPAAYNPPTNPEAGFKISINQGAEYTNSSTVNLTLIVGSDTVRMAISEFPDFKNASQFPFQQEIKWELLPIPNSQIPKQGIKRILYAKFYTQYGVSSQVYSDSIIIIASLPVIPAPSVIPQVSPQSSPKAAAGEATPHPSPKAAEGEAQPAPPPPYFETPPEKPEPVNPDWNLIKLPEVKNFSPQTNEISFFTEKFSSLAETFKKLGISQISDIASRVPSVSFSIPNLWKILKLQPADSNPTPLADLPANLKEQIPSEVVFVSAASGKINLDSSLVMDENSLKQKISAPSSTNLSIAFKPDKPARSISGYIALKKSAYSANPAPEGLSFWDDISSFLISSASAQESKPQEVEQRFVLAQFQYSDSDKDGIWTADIQTPAVTGEYEIISLISYQNQSIPAKEIRLITVIDPEGYVYRKEANEEETRVKNVKVSIYRLNPANNQYELWPAQNFDQKNPQTTDATGKYSFLVPAGSYYLKAEAPGYYPHQSDNFAVSEAGNVHMNLELKPKFSLARDWEMIAIAGLAIVALILAYFLAYNFYQDRRRKG
ncbi:MAG: carboxypeptidase-like regulatory domain-containing protein [bacterium]|nr:carboxypeptidase-like regulatory domain-containing protein [bacterium]